MTETPKTDKFKKFARAKKTEADDFSAWLATLGATPKLHVNGGGYSTAVITVDFGTPLDESPKMTPEQNAELVARMKTLTKTFHKSDVNVRVQNDSANGIWWSTVA